MKIKQLLVLLLALSLLLAGCVRKTPEPSDSDSENVSESSGGADDTEYIPLVVGGKAQLMIVSEGSEFNGAADRLQSLLLSKTAVTFTVRRFDPDPDAAGKIFVGSSYAEVTGDAGESLRGIVWKDGNLYVCADSAEDAELTVTELVSLITLDMISTDENGKINCSIPETLTFTKEVSVSISNATLMGEPLSELRFVIPQNATAIERYLAERLSADVTENLGASLETVTDSTAASSGEIVIGNTERTPSADFYGTDKTVFDYSLKKSGGSIYIGVGGIPALDKIIEEFEALYMDADDERTDISGRAEDSYCISKTNESDIRIMTYNSLVLDWDTENRDGEHRMQLVAETVNLYKPDFIGFQEHLEDSKAIVLETLDSAYEYVTFSGTEANRVKYIPIVYNSEVWQLEEKGVWQSCPTEAEGKAWGYAFARFCRIDDPSEELVMFNLHYCGNNEYALYDEFREDAAAELNARVKALMEAEPDTPIVITGDFNDTRYGTALKKTIEGLALETSYVVTKDTNVGAEGSTGKNALPIDHIIVTKELVEVVRQRNLLHAPMEFASDHTPHFADIRRK